MMMSIRKNLGSVKLLFVGVMIFLALPQRQTIAQQVEAPAEPELSLTLIREGGGNSLLMQEFFDVVEEYYPEARSEWDIRSEEMRIEAGGHQLRALGRQPAVVIDGRLVPVERPIVVRGGRVLIPERTARLLFQTLAIEVIADEPEAAPAPAVPPVGAAATPAPTPGVTPAATAAIPPTPAGGPQPVTMRPPERRTPVAPAPGGAPALQAPAAMAGSIGLSWAQLADLAHRRPPSRVLIVADRELERAAQVVADGLRSEGLEAEVIVPPLRARAGSGLVEQVTTRRPDLVVDLMAAANAEAAEQSEGALSIWVVNSALWPQDQGPAATALEGPRVYRRHEFQSLALGSLLRTHVGDLFKEAPVTYELAPLYLLRRVDAPAAAVHVPTEAATDAEQSERVGQAVLAGVADYIRGMARVQF